MMETDTVRLRLSFQDRHVLNKSQKIEGLKQSWILLKPQPQTISQLSAHLLHIFNLHDACPNGLILSMDGFVLPPFESTCILKDKDIVCVKKKRGVSAGIVEVGAVGDGVNSLEVEIVEKQPENTANVKLLANEEFDKEIGGYDSDTEEEEDEELEQPLQAKNAAEGCSFSKKRKASKKLQGSKRKRSKKATAEECLLESKDIEDDVSTEKDKSSHHDGILPQKSLVKKGKSSDRWRGMKKSDTPKIAERNTNDAKRLCQPHENGDRNVEVSCTPSGTKKVPSRSARRKKAKRRWLREKLKAEREEQQQKQSFKNDNQQSPDTTKFTEVHQLDQNSDAEDDKDNTEFTQEHQLDQNSDAEDDIVPVVVRPGHIRFEPLGKVDANQAGQQNHSPVETFRLNGITSKKKGQKWGIDKSAASKWYDRKNFYQDYTEPVTIEKATIVNEDIDFEKLKSYAGLPKEGDVVAYRLIELSSSWTPELSSFRVGKISQYDRESNKILLVPVPEYPIACDGQMDEESSGLQTTTSLYREDGSLEVDFSSLLDVRIVKHGNTSSSKSFAAEGNVDNQNAVVSQPQNNNEETHTPAKENGPINAWEEISQALSAKKEQLSQENGWMKKPSSGKSSWSYKALRGSALGPIMSRLRAENGI